MKFTVEPRYSVPTGAFSITLAGRISDGLWQPICRYDVHPSPHENKAFCETGKILIPSGSIHRHTYSEDAIRRTGAWHKCAELLFVREDFPHAAKRREQVKRSFLEGLKMKLVDKDAFRKFMEFDKS